MKKMLLHCIALAIFTIPSIALSQNLPDLDSLSTKIKPEVSAVRSLDFDEPFTVRYYSPADIDTSDASDFYPQEYIENYDQIIRTIGLYHGEIPLNSQIITGLQEEDVELPPYYDPIDRSINIPRPEYLREGADLEFIMAHELTHALQDMHFDLDRLLTSATNSDQFIARQALVEGGATLVEILVRNARAAPDQRASDSQLQQVINDALNVMPPEGPPGFLFEQYHTPYVRGRAFVFALKRHGGWDAVNRAYINLPASSEHILHPDKYIAGESPEKIALPALAREPFAGDWESLDRNTLGELGFRNIFNAFDLNVETAHAAAAGWHGDQYAVFKHRQENNTFALALFTTWDTEQDAAEFMTAYNKVLAIKRGTEDFRIKQNGRDVLIAESPRARDLNELFAYVEKVRSGLVAFDFDGDGMVGFSDFLAFAAHFGRSSSDPDFDERFDFDADGMVGFSDFLAFAAAFGKTVAPKPNAKPAVVFDPRIIHRTLGFVR